MAVIEQSALLRCKDENGNEYLLYPITKLDCVDGAEDLVHYDKDQELSAVQKAQFLKNIGGLCAPVSAQTNQFLKVSAVDENGNVTVVETAEVEASGDSGSVGEATQSDWNVTDETDPAYIKNKPFGEYEDRVELLPDTTYDGFAYNPAYGAYMKDVEAPYILNIGETYMVNWDGVEYECVAQDAGSVISGAIALGNCTAFGLSGNNEPFAVALISNEIGVWTVYFALTDTADGGSHSVYIYQNGTIIKKIDPEYIPIPFFGKTTISETLIDGNYKYIYNVESTNWDIESLIPFTSDARLTAGEIYTVVWNGAEFNCACTSFNGTLCVGNLARFGGADNGLPFMICESDEGFLWLPAEDPDIPVSREVIYSIKLIYEDVDIKKIDAEYLPDMSSLPEVTTSDAGKFLRVSDEGAWVAETIPNAEGVGF